MTNHSKNEKKYIVISLVVICGFSAFIAGFFLFEKIDAEKLLPLDYPIECPPDVRMAQPVWTTYINRTLGFSIEYPEVLVPKQWNNSPLVLLRTRAEENSNILLGADIAISTIPKAETDGISGISEYRCSPIKYGGAARASADIYLGSRHYQLSVVGMSLEDAERMASSIKPL